MITHRFPLTDWKRAVRTIARRKRTGAVKVLLEP
jgi:threonine dehydrogenase-like Zn-dependent dehydrogenase